MTKEEIKEGLKDIASKELMYKLEHFAYSFFMQDDLLVESWVSCTVKERTQQKVTRETWRELTLYRMEKDRVVEIGGIRRFRYFGVERCDGEFGEGPFPKEIKEIKTLRDYYSVTFVNDEIDIIRKKNK